MKKYDHKEVESKWQQQWEEDGLYKTSQNTDKKKCYVLDMFPYPSGEGLHVGHPKGYIATDVYSRFKQMNGMNVLHPMGWDAFGLPAEQYAIKNKIHPRVAVKKNTTRFKKQLANIGFNYDWDREIDTTDPGYYKWTQWIFLKLFEQGLAYESYEPINWCPTCQTGLANEDLEGGKCERCDTVVEKKPMRQWVLKITDYADRLLEDLDLLPEWPDSVKELQKNWIGRSEGARLTFSINTDTGNEVSEFDVFTTRPDTLFGCTYCVMSPEHPLIKKLSEHISNLDAIHRYQTETSAKTEIERTDATRRKTGIKLEGVTATNPANNERIPIFVADYVLPHYGTGAIMAVPAHDERDYTFAQKFGIPIIEVIAGGNITKEAYVGEGTLINSGDFSGLSVEKAKQKITAYINGELTTTYRLQEWVFSRQRYWGEPIPIIHCEQCGAVPVPEDNLPVELPDVESYQPTGTGESPLAEIDEWVNTTCPKCAGAAKRETNTMPQWAGSSWYYLRYIDPRNDTQLVDKEKDKYWSPVDMYVGGMEHATRHLIYARFWHKFLYDIGVVSTKEPFMRLKTVGLIQAEDGRKMSKRWGNVINPDEVVENVGADTLRTYEMFMGPFEQAIAWSTDNMVGSRRFLEKVWRIKDIVANQGDRNETLLHQTIKKVGNDIEKFDFNTAISAMMVWANDMDKRESVALEEYIALIQILAPFAPHITEELWSQIGGQDSIHKSTWPKYVESKIQEDTVTLAVQVNGRVRDTITVKRTVDQLGIKESALASNKVQKWLDGKEVKKVIVVPGKIVNIVI